MTIVGMDGRPISTVGTNSNKGKITKSEASAIIVSEIDMAIEGWNENSKNQHLTNPQDAPLFKLDFEKKEYVKEAQDKLGYFGYGLLTLSILRRGKTEEIYRRAVNCKSKRDLDNVNGYFPDMSYDLSLFLFHGAFLYNLTLLDLKQNPQDYESKEVIQPPADSKGKPGVKRKRGTGS